MIEHLALYGNGSQAVTGDGGVGAQAVFPPGVPCIDCRISSATTDNGSGARLQYCYVDRVLTNVPLLPWLMEQRGLDELGVSITAIMQQYSGAIQ